MASITQTQMNLAEKCPMSWYYYRKKVPKTQGDERYMLAGSVIHESIEQYFKSISDNPHSGLISGTFTSIIDRNWEPHKEVLKELYSRKTKCTENFIKFEVERLKTCKRYRPTLLEDKKAATVNGIDFFSIIDSYWEEDGLLVDWKSGNKVTLDVQDYIQGTIEKTILQALGHKVNTVMFVMLLSGQKMVMNPQPENFIMERAKKMIQYWMTNTFPKIRGQGCVYCGWNLRCTLLDNKLCLWEL